LPGAAIAVKIFSMDAWKRWSSLRLRTRAAVVAAAVALAAGGYWGVMAAMDRAPLLNYDMVEPGKLLRSGQPKPGDLALIKKEHGLGSIFCLTGGEDDDVIEWARANKVKVVCMKMKADIPPTPDQVDLFFDLMRGDTVVMEEHQDVVTELVGQEPEGPARFPFPVLLHCKGGSDRTGVMTALYHMAFQDWPLKRAKRDMMLHWHLPLSHPAQFEYLEKVAPKLDPYYGSDGGDLKEAREAAVSKEGG